MRWNTSEESAKRIKVIIPEKEIWATGLFFIMLYNYMMFLMICKYYSD